MTARRPELSFVAVQIVVWLALIAVLVGSIRNVAWAFDSVAGGISGGWAWVQAAGVDLGLLAMALGMQLRRKGDRPVAWLRLGAVAFSVVSAGANAMHGYAHQVAAPGVPAWMLLARPWSLGAILPALAFVLIEVAGHNVDKLIVTKPTTKEAIAPGIATAAMPDAIMPQSPAIVAPLCAKDAAFALWRRNPDAPNEEVAAAVARSLRTVQLYRAEFAAGRNGHAQEAQ